MTSRLLRRLARAAGSLPNLFEGFNIYVNRDKLRLIDYVFKTLSPGARSFADLGGVWKVDAAYTTYTMRNYRVDKGVIVDTDYPEGLKRRLQRQSTLKIVQGDFGRKEIVESVGAVDMIYFFDVLLHQASPDWDEILEIYSRISPCFVIYNQQFIGGGETIRLTKLPLERFVSLTTDVREETYRYVYEHRNELHPQYHKPWGDIHNVAQWGITDKDLRSTMSRLGYREVYFRNHGRFLDLEAFENHAFVFHR
jgi:hypothetical protein